MNHTVLPSINRRSLVQGLAAMAAASWVLPARSANPIVIQFSHVVTPDTAKGKAALRFKQLAEAQTGGRVRVEVYPDSTLYKDREEMEALRLGAVQMLAPSLSKLAGVGGGDFEVFDLPFLFPSQSAFRTVTQGPVGQRLLSRLEASGIKGLAYWDNGFKVFTANRPLRTPADFRGLKFRVQASRTLVAQMKVLGASASISPLIQVEELLRKGELDGQENVPTNVFTQRLHEVQSHLTVSRHGYLAYAVIVNATFWQRLPEDIRRTLESAMREATQYANAISEAENEAALKRIADTGRIAIHHLSPGELAQWRRAMAPVADHMREWISPATVAAVRQAAGTPP